MLPALLTTLLFSLSAVAGSRLSRLLGGVYANWIRMLLATILLGLYAHTFGKGFSGKALPYFLMSGVVGFGIGDLALYQAFPRIGSRLCMILVHCLAAPIAATVEWIWLGTVLTPFQLLCSSVILIGVALALAPSEHLHIPRPALITGIALGLVAAFCQAGGAVLSRKAYEVVHTWNESLDGVTAAYQRIWGGIPIATVGFLFMRWRDAKPRAPFLEQIRTGWKWLVMNATAGPALGVSCFQWALATTPTGIVLPIVALTPLTIIPFAIRFEGEKPSIRSLIGGIIAVAGVAGLRISMAAR
jgi:drug/metabolite transporter (DMT)-like permease